MTKRQPHIYSWALFGDQSIQINVGRATRCSPYRLEYAYEIGI